MLSSLFGRGDVADTSSMDLYFGPTPPADRQDRWAQTLPGAGWSVYSRIYGPEAPPFDHTWKPGDNGTCRQPRA